MDADKERLTYLKVMEYQHKNGENENYDELPRPNFSLAYLYSGTVRLTSAGSVVTASAGELIFIPYRARYSSFWSGDETICFITLHFNFAPTSYMRLFDYPVQKISGHTALGETFRRLADPDGTPFSRLADFYSVLSAVYPQMEKTPVSPMDERIKKAIAHLEEHMAETVTVEDLAKECYMSVSHFYSRFREETGLSPIAYRNRIRIDRAQHLLLDRENSVRAVSEALGFESTVYFRRIFKSTVGLSPKEYRDQVGNVL